MSARLPRVPPAPAASSPAVRAVMQGVRGKDTKPELALRRELHRRGLRYRIHQRIEAGDRRCNVDIAFRPARLVVFVDGCRWHKCPIHHREPRTNADYWNAKLARNVARDRANDAALAAAGWHVVRVWEHEDPAEAADRVQAALAEARGAARTDG
jgi:DNA mismatch endonuclease (patch repair protein)